MNNRSNAGGFPLSFAAAAAAAGGGRIHGSRRFYPDGRYRGATRDGEAWGGGNRGPPPPSPRRTERLGGAIGERSSGRRRTPGFSGEAGRRSRPSRGGRREREGGGGSDETAEEDLLVGNEVVSSQRISLGFSDRRSDQAQRQAERRRVLNVSRSYSQATPTRGVNGLYAVCATSIVASQLASYFEKTTPEVETASLLKIL
ncbi:hypothetical protein NL676_009778 [Syzygium grande]|nr:hypothetical protein NL676_009778 [Syzygium grande]